MTTLELIKQQVLANTSMMQQILTKLDVSFKSMEELPEDINLPLTDMGSIHILEWKMAADDAIEKQLVFKILSST